ncbi:hypothetical protein SANTM175S_03258 [Streptomyces antimycoticus]
MAPGAALGVGQFEFEFGLRLGLGLHERRTGVGRRDDGVQRGLGDRCGLGRRRGRYGLYDERQGVPDVAAAVRGGHAPGLVVPVLLLPALLLPGVGLPDIRRLALVLDRRSGVAFCTSAAGRGADGLDRTSTVRVSSKPSSSGDLDSGARGSVVRFPSGLAAGVLGVGGPVPAVPGGAALVRRGCPGAGRGLLLRALAARGPVRR